MSKSKQVNKTRSADEVESGPMPDGQDAQAAAIISDAEKRAADMITKAEADG